MGHHGEVITRRTLLLAAAAGSVAACSGPRPEAGPATGEVAATTSAPPPTAPAAPTADDTAPTTEDAAPTTGSPREILARSTVPVLSYHQLREHRTTDDDYTRAITLPPALFREHMEAVRDAGYRPVSIQMLADHLELGAPELPDQPILLSFDDGSIGQYTVGLPTLSDLGMVGTLFPMTVVLGNPDWVTRGQVREFAQEGWSIGAHTWDHQRLDQLPADQWATQVEGPRQELGEITGQEVVSLAYPHGVWNQDALDMVERAGYRIAFQLGDQPQDRERPLLTVRRFMPPSAWDGQALVDAIASF